MCSSPVETNDNYGHRVISKDQHCISQACTNYDFRMLVGCTQQMLFDMTFLEIMNKNDNITVV